MLIHSILVSWQLEQLPVMPLWIMVLVGAGNMKPLPGAARVATPATSPLGVLPKWQLSQVVPDAMCEPTPGVAEGGITTMLLTP
jgi:hypothetical protein